MFRAISASFRKNSRSKRIAVLLCCIAAMVCSCQKKQHAEQYGGIENPAHSDTLLVMEYNVENLFDMVDNGTEYHEFKPNTCNWTNSTYAIKRDNIASVIVAAHPHIAVLLEIENENSLNDLLRVLKKKKCNYCYYTIEKKDKNKATVSAIISCVPLLSSAKTTSAYLESNALWGKDTLAIFACHWPSKKYPESQRILPAQLLIKRLEALPRLRDYVVAGDMNENYDECTTFGTMGFDNTNGKTALNHILGTASENSGTNVDYTTKQTIFELKRIAHYDPWLDIPEKKRMSETFRHQYQTPDHILLPASLFDTSGLSYADSSFRVFTWSKRLLYYGAPYRWQMRFQGKQKTHKGEGYSDHLPIMVKLCRNSFVRAKDTVVRKEIPGRKTISIRAGFESSCEGWVAGEPKIHVMRDTVAPAVGHYCLKIAGQAGKQNGCAARVLLHCSNAHPANCRLRIKGSGEFSFRMRPKESEKWTYYTGPDFKPAQAGKYSVYDFKEWTQLYLLIIDTIPDNKDYELEIRVKKESTVCIWLDTVVLQQS